MGGELVVQGEDLEAWIAGQRAGWEGLTPAQRFLLESIAFKRRRTTKWWCWWSGLRRIGGCSTSRRPASSTRVTATCVSAEGGEVVGGEQVKVGAFLDNARRRAAKLGEQRWAELDVLGMRWM
ncbi:hypothetical protein ACFWFU_07870 [Streptomyces sp. NPDC060235]|uniref:hypothetical protein n=1 Tax=Streptomyces sp. NPDC060235 TaxID=3347080 RepID=UPI003663D85F